MKDEGGSVKSGQWSRPRTAAVRIAAASMLVACGVLAGQALAQEQAGLTVSSELEPPGVLAQPESADLSPDQRLERAKGFVDTIEHAAQSIQRQLQSARKDRDVVRVLCLNDKLNQVDVALRSARDRVAALGAAVDRKDTDRSRHEFTVLEVLNDRVRTLVNESSQCIGEETGFIGEAEVSVSIDPNLPDGNTGFALDSAALPPPPNISSPIE
jgi:hypothetical protein